MSYQPLQVAEGFRVYYPVPIWHYGRFSGYHRKWGVYGQEVGVNHRGIQWRLAHAGHSIGGRGYAEMKAVDARRASYVRNEPKRREKAEARRMRPIEKAREIAAKYGRGLTGKE